MGGRPPQPAVIALGRSGCCAARGSSSRPRRPTLGLDLKGGTELIYQARPTPQTPTIDAVGDRPRDRDHPQARPTPSASPSRRSRRIGVGRDPGRPARTSRTPTQASEQIGHDRAALLLRLGGRTSSRPNPAPDDPAVAARARAPTFPDYYDAVKFASKQKPECFQNKCTTNGPHVLPLRRARRTRWIAGPADRPSTTCSSTLPGQKQPPSTRDPHRAAGDGGGREGADQGQSAPSQTRGRTPSARGS